MFCLTTRSGYKNRSQWQLDCWECGFESRWGHGVLLWVLYVVSASGWSLVQRSRTKCGVSECNRKSSIMRSPWPTGGYYIMVKKKVYLVSVVDEWNVGMKRWWNDADREKPEYSEIIPFQCHPVNYKPHTDWPGNKYRWNFRIIISS